MPKELYFCCDEGHYSKEPKGFDERLHFVKCSTCRKTMYLTHGSPELDGFQKKLEIQGTLIPQTES